MHPKIFTFSPAPKYTYLVVGTFVSSKYNITVNNAYPLAEIFRVFFFAWNVFHLSMVDKTAWSRIVFPGRYILQVPFFKTDLDAYKNCQPGRVSDFFISKCDRDISITNLGHLVSFEYAEPTSWFQSKWRETIPLVNPHPGKHLLFQEKWNFSRYSWLWDIYLILAVVEL